MANFVRDVLAARPPDDVIISAGYRIGPVEVEATLLGHPAVRAETAPYKYPRRVRFVDALPKTTSGKIHRAALRNSP